MMGFFDFNVKQPPLLMKSDVTQAEMVKDEVVFLICIHGMFSHIFGLPFSLWLSAGSFSNRQTWK